MTAPHWRDTAHEIIRVIRATNNETEALAGLVALKLQLAYETGRGAGMDESRPILDRAIAALRAEPKP